MERGRTGPGVANATAEGRKIKKNENGQEEVFPTAILTEYH